MLVHIPEPIQRTGFLPFEVPGIASRRVVDLNLEAFFGKAGFLIRRVKVNARIAIRMSCHFKLELEIAKVRVNYRTCIEQM